MFARAIVIVLDSVGIGELPDAPLYEDQGSNTLGNIAAQVPLKIPALTAMGLSSLVSLEGILPAPSPTSAYGRMAERSPGKDSVTGHWELMGIVLDRPFPTFPDGFPADLITEFESRIGRQSIGNVVASGTAVIDELGPQHMETGYPIVYTSADSVFQIAAHEAIVPVPQLYKWCDVAYDLAVKGLGLGRVIARPFIGLPGSFQRTANRHDYAMPPMAETLLDRMVAAGQHVASVGKISDLFAGRGISESHPTASDAEGVDQVLALMATQHSGLIFANLVDFDTVYGHRNDTLGYARNLEQFDARLPRLRGETPRRRSARDHRRSRQRSDDAQHGSLPRTRAGAAARPRGEGRCRSRNAIDLRRSWADAGKELPRRSACRTARASWAR